MKQTIAFLFLAGSFLVLAGAENRTGKDFEQQFLTKTPHHHQQAIEMAQLCEQKAAKAEVKDFCSKLSSSQREEKQKMDDWRQSWYQGQGEVPKAEMQKMEAKHKKHMSELNAASGEKFDDVFLTAMTEHHRDGLPDMRACQARAVHAELKELCSKMSADQQKDIKQMQSWMGGSRRR